MKKLYLGLLILCLIVLNSVPVSAQENAPKTKFMVWEVTVTPEQHGKLLEAVKFQHEFLKEVDYPYLGYVNYTNDGVWWYATPFQKYAELDEMDALDAKLWEEHPEKQKEIWAKFDGNFKSVAGQVFELQPEISNMQPPSEQSGTMFRFFERIYIKNGKLMEFTEIAKRYKALREKHGITDSYGIYYPRVYSDMSMVFMIDAMGENASEHYSLNSKKWEKFGEEGQKLWEDFAPMVEKIETHIGTFDADASYIPNK